MWLNSPAFFTVADRQPEDVAFVKSKGSRIGTLHKGSCIFVWRKSVESGVVGVGLVDAVYVSARSIALSLLSRLIMNFNVDGT